MAVGFPGGVAVLPLVPLVLLTATHQQGKGGPHRKVVDQEVDVAGDSN